MKKLAFFFSIFIFFSYQDAFDSPKQENNKKAIDQLLNQWHKDVAEFNFDSYFSKMTEDAIFVGTDASEVWSKNEFKKFSKPYFDKQQTWDFKPISRNIYFDKTGKTAWFDELLDTWMGVCRGSGVIVKTGKQWKIQHYVLSVTIPNEDIKAVVFVKKKRDSLFLIQQKKPVSKKQ